MQFLHVEDNPNDAELVHLLLRREWPDCSIERVDTKANYEAALERLKPTLILSDFSLPTFDGITALKMARKAVPHTPFIFLSGTIGEEVAVEALKNGAIDYVLKDRMGRLVPAVQRAVSQAEEQNRRRQAEAELKATQERYRQITENVADLIAVLDPQGHRIYNNPAYRAILGDNVDLQGTDAFTEIHPADRDRVRQIFRETVRTGVGERTEYRLLARDGTVRFIESQGSVTRDETGAVSNVLVVSRDVTSRKQAEQRIREQASLLDKARDAICVIDLSHRVTYWNASAEALFEWTAAEAAGLNVQAMIFQEEQARYAEAIKKLLAEGRWEGELRPQTKSGRTVTVESRWSLVSDENGNPKSILSINTDVTEKKRLEVQFLRAQRMESIGTLAGGIAHDLNNVLTPILVASQVLQAQASKEDSALLETIEKSALHGAALIKQVLLFARGAEGDHTTLQVKHLIMEMGTLLKETLPRSIEIHTAVDRDLWMLKGDATQLNQVLMNLCVNARDAMTNGGKIEIRAKNVTPSAEFLRIHPELKPGPTVMISVEDNGSGIPPHVLDRIWDPFFTTKEVGKGTGLGLSTVLGIVKGHSGTVNVVSEINRGTRFEIYLPALASEEAPPTSSSRAPLPRGNGEGVLVIDDEAYIRDVIASMLRYCGYTGFFAADGLKGIEVYQRNHDKIALVLVDMMMPGLDGASTMRMLRDLNPEVKLIAMSGMLENATIGPDTDLEKVELLRKPIAAEELLSTIGAAIGGKVPARAT
ncbi:MAG TPA: PAS domain S-box protein [Opitutaceae bacterium]|nr:PAS domain S-box protein [Opitutaceae bacterium]